MCGVYQEQDGWGEGAERCAVFLTGVGGGEVREQKGVQCLPGAGGVG